MAALRPLLSGALVGSLAAGIAGQLSAVLSGVIAARTLGPHGRGQLALLYLIPLVATLVGSLGTPLAVTYYIARTPSQARSIVLQVIPVIFAQMIVATGVAALVILGPVLSRYPTIDTAATISLALPAVLFGLTYASAILQGLRHYNAFNLVRVAPPALFALGLVAIAVAGVGDLTVIVCTMLAASLTAATVGWIMILRAKATNRDPSTVSRRSMLRFGMRGLLGASSPVDDLQLDQLIVGLVLGAYDLGLYVAALAFTNLPRFLAQSVGLVAYPTIASERGPHRRQLARRYVLIGLGLVVPVVLVLEVTVEWLVRAFYGDAFSGAVETARILLVGAIFFAARRLLSDVANGLGRPAVGSIAELVALAVLVPSVALLAGVDSPAGIAIATGISSLASVLAILALLRWGASTEA